MEPSSGDRIRLPLLLAVGLCNTYSQAVAQLPDPRLTAIAPAGWRADETIDVIVTGTDLEGADKLRFDHPGLRAFRLKDANKFRVAIAPGTPSGAHDVRVVGTFGVTNPRVFVVGEGTEVREVEPNERPVQATPISLNSVVHGVIQASPDVDCFRLEGRGGQRVVVEVESRRLDGRLDPVLRLLSADGRVLAESRRVGTSEPVIDATLPADGSYYLKLHDTTYAGGPDFVYRLSVTEGPKASSAAWSFLPSSREVGAPVAAGSALPEVEPNDPDHPQEVTLPVEIDGAFASPGDLDAFRFQAKKGQVWWFDVWADRLGRPTDASFVLQKVVANGPPADVAVADDLADPTSLPRFPSHTVDPRLRWAVPEDGTFQIVLSDVFGSQRGDAALSYRMQVRAERPDFQLFLVPANPTLPGATTLRTGGRAVAYVQARRLDGFARPIRVEAIDLPEGLSCGPALIGPGQTTAPLVLTASASVSPGEVALRVIGRGLSPDRKEAIDDSARPGPEMTHEAVPGQIIGPVDPAIQPPPPAPARVTREFVVAVREGAPFQLAVGPTEIWLAQGETGILNVIVTRRDGFTEGVNLTLPELPPKVTASAATIARDANAGSLTVTVAKDAPPGVYSLVVRGSGPMPFSKDPNAKTRPNVNVVEPANVVLLNIRK
jgi:hypothetical protein